MSKKQAISFFKEVAKNKQLAEKVNEVVGGQATNQAKAAKLLSLAKKNHFDFTKEEASLAKDELKTALQIEDLSEVSGGRGKVMSAVMAATLLTGGLGVTGATTNVESSAMFSIGKGSGNPAPTGQKGDGRDEGLPSLAPELMESVGLRSSVLKSKYRPQSTRRMPANNGDRSEISVLDMTEDTMREEIVRLRRENERLEREKAEYKQKVDQLKESLTDFGQGNLMQLKEENRNLKEENRQLKETFEVLGEKVVEYDEIIRDKNKELKQKDSEADKRLEEFMRLQHNRALEDAKEIKELRNEKAALKEREETHIKRLFQRMFPQLRQMLAFNMPSCASVAIVNINGTRTVKFTVYEDDLKEGEVQLPSISWKKSTESFDVSGILTVRDDGVYVGEEPLAEFNDCDVAHLPAVLFSIGSNDNAQLPIQVVRSDQRRPRNTSPHLIFSDVKVKTACFGVLPGHAAATSNTPEDKWRTLQNYFASGSSQNNMIMNTNQQDDEEDQSYDETQYPSNSVNNNNNLNNFSVNNRNDEIPDTDMITQENSQTTETQQQSNNRSQRTYNLNGREVPLYQRDYSVDDLYLQGGVTISDYGAAPVIYSPSEVVSGKLFAGPGNNSVVRFRATDSDTYSVDPYTGDVTANFTFDSQYRGLQTNLLSAVGFLQGMADPNDAIQLNENAPNIFYGLGLVGANGNRGNFIVNVHPK